jgi:hypothetical protein
MVRLSGGMVGMTIRAVVSSWIERSAKEVMRFAIPAKILLSIAIGLMFNSAS